MDKNLILSKVIERYSRKLSAEEIFQLLYVGYVVYRSGGGLTFSGVAAVLNIDDKRAAQLATETQRMGITEREKDRERMRELKAFLLTAEQFVPQDSSPIGGPYVNNFQPFLVQAHEVLRLTDFELARLFDFSVPSIERWVYGETVPPLVTQKFVKRIILDELRRAIATLKAKD